MNLLRCLFIAAIAISSALSLYGQTAAELKRASDLFKQGTENYQNSRYDAAIVNYSEYIKIRPTVATGWYNRGLAYKQKAEAAMSRQDFERAEADISQAIKLNPNDADFWLNRGFVRLRLVSVDFNRQMPQAIADFTQVIKLKPMLADGYTGRAQAFYESNRLAEAMADLNKALQLNPNDYVALFTRGKLHSSAKRYAAARADLEKAIRLYPQYDAAKSYLNFVNANDPTRSATAVRSPLSTPPKPPVASSAVTTTAITNLSDGFKRAEDAEKARDHRKVIDAVTATLPLIKMRTDSEPADELKTHVYLDLLRKRARANMALKLFGAADNDYKKAGMDALNNMNRHIARSHEEASRDKVSGAGGIMASLEASKATIICKSSFASVSEWVDAIERDRPDQMPIKLTSVFLLAATRELCASAYTIQGMWQTVRMFGDNSQRTENLNKAIADYTEALRYMKVHRNAYVHRAKAYRELGRIDLALADEKKASELPAGKN